MVLVRREVPQGQRENQMQTWDENPGLLIMQAALWVFCSFVFNFPHPRSACFIL